MTTTTPAGQIDDELRALSERATPGTWIVAWADETGWIGQSRGDGKVKAIVAGIDLDSAYKREVIERKEADADLIVEWMFPAESRP